MKTFLKFKASNGFKYFSDLPMLTGGYGARQRCLLLAIVNLANGHCKSFATMGYITFWAVVAFM